MKLKNISRRKFILTTLLATPVAFGAEAVTIEPTWLKVRRLRIGSGNPSCRLAHFSDLHHKGDCKYLQTVVDTINSLAPDFACFTGDIVENREHLSAALEILSGIRVPMYGVPGNHDYHSGVSFDVIAKCFAATGGAWLLNETQKMADGKLHLVGAACNNPHVMSPPPVPGGKNLLLMHYPGWTNKLAGQQFDLMLAGHSHGGQVRIPFYGPVVVPFGCGGYDLGLYQTGAGPLYVNPGIGYIGDYNFRFNCRPEITVIEV